MIEIFTDEQNWYDAAATYRQSLIANAESSVEIPLKTFKWYRDNLQNWQISSRQRYAAEVMTIVSGSFPKIKIRALEFKDPDQWSDPDLFKWEIQFAPDRTIFLKDEDFGYIIEHDNG